jgi:putative Mg2+ transporter-C (MgtC) family protein
MLPLTTILARLAWAGLLGSLIGVERNLRRRPAGMRTGFCVCLGAAFFTIVSVELARRTGDSSSTRIASNIVQGIGFLGAGVILRERGSVVGLTTAATIFATAAIGMAAGGGLYLASGAACLFVLFALVVLVYVENALHLKRRSMLFRITTESPGDLVAEIHRVFGQLDVAVDNLHLSLTDGKNLIQFDADVSARQQEKIVASLMKPGITYEMLPVEQQAE